MLFQPTFISPSLQWGIGNGTVDVDNGIEFSWQVNGSSAMTSFQIAIYKNDTNSTSVYSTGELTDGCPFYGTNYAGETQMFTYFIQSSSLTGAGMTNGEEYKFVITQWWDTTESIQQSSATAFKTRSTPTLTLTAFETPLSTRSATFTATYSQEEGDALSWVRWQISLTSDTANPFFDTDKIYGTSELQVSYDGFFTGTEYAVRCIVQTENGVEVSTGWEIFEVSYATNSLTGVVDAKCVCNHSAVKVSWDEVTYIPAVVSGTYEIINSTLNLPLDSAVSWSSVNGNGMNFPSEWTAFYKTRLDLSTTNGVDWLLITLADGSIALRKMGNRILARINGSNISPPFVTDIEDGDDLTVCITPNAMYYRLEHYGGGLYPDTTLSPSDTLYPQDDELISSSYGEMQLPSTFVQSSITAITINGAQIVDYIVVENGTASDNVIQQVLNGTFVPTLTGNAYFYASFDNGLNAGNIAQTGDTLIGYAVYRRQGVSGTLQHIIDVPIGETSVYDFGVASQQGEYTYYVFPIGETTYIAEPLVSNEIYPIFWEWTILQCTQREDGTYAIGSEFRFANNVETGTVSNNNTPNVVSNFTRYPTVFLARQNYQSGTLSALIGAVDYTTNTYSDTIALRDAIYELSTTTDTLFLKNRKGDVMEIKISAPIQMATSDNTVGQIQSTSIPWVQVNDAKNTPIVATEDDSIIA